MGKSNKKGKGPKPPQGGKGLDENSLSQLTSRIDQRLKGNDHKRKQPPTNDKHGQDRKRPRNSSKGPSNSQANGSRVSLLEEIRALGGDEEDLALIEDIDSSDESLIKDDKKPLDKSLKAELAAFSKNLGFDNYQPSEASDDPEDADEGDEPEDESEDSYAEGDGDEQDENQEDGLEADDEDTGPRKVENLVSACLCLLRGPPRR